MAAMEVAATSAMLSCQGRRQVAVRGHARLSVLHDVLALLRCSRAGLVSANGQLPLSAARTVIAHTLRFVWCCLQAVLSAQLLKELHG